MIFIKKILLLVFILQRTRAWIPIKSSFLSQSVNSDFVVRNLRLMLPPAPERVFVQSKDLHGVFGEVDFQKPKTQTFYSAALTPSQPPVYEFRYKIHDPKEENFQEKSETRVGDTVRGYYSVREPNGYVRLVKYVSDENGFQTQVSHHHTSDNEGAEVFTLTRYNT